MKIIDLSQPVYDAAPNCPAHPPVQMPVIADHPADGWRVEMMSFATHTGSHLDAPLHKLADGRAISDYPLEAFAGTAHLCDLRGIEPNEEITPAMLREKLPANLSDTIVLLATGWGDKRAKTEEWLRDSPFLGVEGARWLCEQGVRGVGIDHYSVGGSREPGNERTHEVLLGSGLWIVEELRFPPEIWLVPQPFRFMALPLNLPGCSGAPCRPVALVQE